MAQQDKTFYLYGGKQFSNIEEFAKELVDMSDEAYHHHVTFDKNDFANWLRFSLNHNELADSIDGFVPRFHVELHVLRHLVHKTPKSEHSSNKKTNLVKVDKHQSKKK
jgi:hypothetical protein